MYRLRRPVAALSAAVLGVGIVLGGAVPAQATIHPIVQSVLCASAQAWAHADVGDPPGQTPAGFVGESISISGTWLTVTFVPEPLTFTKSDFRALQATKFIDHLVTTADGKVVAVVVDLTAIPKAASGMGGMHCANG
ncbi:MAG: hypothetical protein ABIX44_06500 [Cryobacterium sp.]